MAPIRTKTRGITILSRAGLFALIWWILSDGVAASWWIGAPAVALAVAVSIVLVPATPFVWFELLRFVPFFLVRSLLGGVDVAWRAFHPRMPIAPMLIEYPLRLPPGLAQVFMVNTASLLPGTLVAELGHNVLKVHVLEGGKSCLPKLKVVEQNVARIFGASLSGLANKTPDDEVLPVHPGGG